jgi:riboflavin synthase
MFSGIVEEMGAVKSLEKRTDLRLWDGSEGEGVQLLVKAPIAVQGATLGCSIAVNGVCLTVTEFGDDWFSVGLAPETLRRSNLGDLQTGDPVNIERALPSGERNSGHYVQGHVDGTGTIMSMTPENDSLWVKVAAPSVLLNSIVTKGFVAVDGTSLTVVDVNRVEGWFTFMLVAYTQQHIIIPRKQKGDRVNLETDVLGKYVERSLSSVVERLERLEDMLGPGPRERVNSIFVEDDEEDEEKEEDEEEEEEVTEEEKATVNFRLARLEWNMSVLVANIEKGSGGETRRRTERAAPKESADLELWKEGVENKVQNRDLILESIEDRLLELERKAGRDI